MNGKREARRNANVIQSVSRRVGRNQQTPRTFAIDSPRAKASPAASDTQQAASRCSRRCVRRRRWPAWRALASSCWQQRDASSARHASLSTPPLLRRKAHSRAHGTVDAERGAKRRCVFEFAERQILDVPCARQWCSGRAQAKRLQLLSARADVNVERADFETAAPLRCDTSRLHSSRTARRRPRAEHAATRTSPPTTQPGSTSSLSHNRSRKARCVALRRPRAARQLAG